MMSHALMIAQRFTNLMHAKTTACEKRLPLLKNKDSVYVLKHGANILRSPLSLERPLEAPMVMVFHDLTYATEFQYQFDPSAHLQEIELGELEAYAHSFNLPLKVIFSTGDHVVRHPRRDANHYGPMLETLYRK